MIVLNQTASDVWRLSDGESDFEEIVRLLAAAYGVEGHVIRREIEDTIRTFKDKSLFETEQD